MSDATRRERGLVTVVIAAHNATRTLSDAVRSALDHELVVQVVVVDDASTDATVDVAGALASEDRRVEVVSRSERGGPSAARNEGLRLARGARVCFLDADDELMAGAIGALSDAMDADRGAVAAIGRFVPVDGHGVGVDVGRWVDDQLRPVVRRDGELVDAPEGISAEALVTRLVSPPPGAWLVDVACARALGGFDVGTRRSEDLELLVRLATAGRVLAVDREVLRYLRHNAQRSAAVTRRRWGRAHTMWRVLRAAPRASDVHRLANGMSAYQRALYDARRSSTSGAVRAMAARNLLAVGGVQVMGAAASLLPCRRLAPLDAPTASAVD
jgi:glycosyltransferase involved in cell wall biosynthesis